MSNKETKSHPANMASAHLQERREVRFAIPIEIEVSGIDIEGRVFHERTFTKNVSEWGCGFVVSVEVKPEDMVAVRVVHVPGQPTSDTRQSFFQVVRVSPEGDGWLIGAWKMNDDDVWGANLKSLAEPDQGDRDSRENCSSNGDPER